MATDYDASDGTHVVTSTLAGTTAGTLNIPDYSDHLNLLNDLVERITLALENMSAKQDLIEQHLLAMKNDHTTIAAKQTIIASEITTIDDNINTIRDLGQNDGLHWRRPHEWTSGGSEYGVNITGTDTINNTVRLTNHNETGA